MMNTAAKEYLCGLKRSDFQTTIDGKETDLFLLTNENGNDYGTR